MDKQAEKIIADVLKNASGTRRTFMRKFTPLEIL